MAIQTKPQAECYCPACGWADRWEDADKVVLYRATRTDPEVIQYLCPVCGEEVVDGSTEYVAHGGGG